MYLAVENQMNIYCVLYCCATFRWRIDSVKKRTPSGRTRTPGLPVFPLDFFASRWNQEINKCSNSIGCVQKLRSVLYSSVPFQGLPLGWWWTGNRVDDLQNTKSKQEAQQKRTQETHHRVITSEQQRKTYKDKDWEFLRTDDEISSIWSFPVLDCGHRSGCTDDDSFLSFLVGSCGRIHDDENED